MIRTLLNAIESRLVEDWRHVWRYGSARFAALSVVMNVYGAIALKGAAAAASVLGLLTMRQALMVGAAVSFASLVARYRRPKPPPLPAITVPGPKP